MPQNLWSVQFTDPCIIELENSLQQGPIIREDNGRPIRRLEEELVGSFGSFMVYIRADEHPPPHFHVKYNGQENSFNILDGSPLYPDGELKRYFRNIQRWFLKNKQTLIDAWNRNRPSDCPVGKINI